MSLSSWRKMKTASSVDVATYCTSVQLLLQVQALQRNKEENTALFPLCYETAKQEC